MIPRPAQAASGVSGNKGEEKGVTQTVLISTNMPIGQRTLPAWNALWDALSDGEWHRQDEVVAAMVAASDILPKTCENRIYNAVQWGGVESVGRYRDRILRRK